MTYPSLLNQTILIVDDNPANLKVLSVCLEQAGFYVLIAQNGESALQKAAYAEPDLIVLDVMMPGIDGFETCKRLKYNPETRTIPVILMTALSDMDSKVKGLEAGAIDYISKPFQHLEVLARINVHLKVHQLMSELEKKNTLLEHEITERRLSEARLKKTLERLGQAQAQLLHSEKMASMGQMVAGIAHELNNPLGFIVGNIQFLQEYTETLIAAWASKKNQVLDSGSAPSSETDSKTDSKANLVRNTEVEIQDENDRETDLDYIVEDIPRVIHSIDAGTRRITEIVKRLKSFSYLDQEGKKNINIHESLEQTLSIVTHRLQETGDRPAIKVIKNYSNIPEIDCYPGQINQVFLNLINNAIDALNLLPPNVYRDASLSVDPSSSPFLPTLTLKTVWEENTVSICIIDNGPGIPNHLQEKIFEPFFTTKNVGQGVGLGLSVCYHIIVNAHRGTLRCTSSPHRTELTIRLPLEVGNSVLTHEVMSRIPVKTPFL